MNKLKNITRIAYKRDPEKGERGAIVRITTWTPNRTYYAGVDGERFADTVYYQGLYYRCLTTHTSVSSQTPYASVQANDGRWDIDSNFEFVATKVVFVGEGAEGWVIDNGEIYHTSGNLSLTKDGCIKASNGNFEVDSEGNVYAKSGVFEGFSKTKFIGFTAGATKISNGVYKVSDNFNLIADGADFGTYSVVLRLPDDASYVGAVLNVYDYPVKTRSSPTLSIEGTMLWQGCVNSYSFVPISKITAPIGGLIQFIGVPHLGGCAWMISIVQMPSAYINDDYNSKV